MLMCAGESPWGLNTTQEPQTIKECRVGETVVLGKKYSSWLSSIKWLDLKTCIHTSDMIQTEEAVHKEYICIYIYACDND